MLAQDDEYMEQAYEKLTRLSADEEKRLEYEAREKAIRDHNYLVKYHTEMGIKKGREQGIAEGREQGIAEGREQGIITLIEAYCEMDVPREFAREKVLSKYQLDEQMVNNLFAEHWTE